MDVGCIVGDRVVGYAVGCVVGESVKGESVG